MSLDVSARISVQSGRENVTSYKQGWLYISPLGNKKNGSPFKGPFIGVIRTPFICN